MAKHKYINNPNDMRELFEAYKEDIKGNPIEVVDWVGGVAKEVTRKHEKPLTISGFRVYCHKIGFSVEHYFANTDKAYDDYRTICRAINDEIRRDQIEGGMAGIYNPSITQRLNGLVDKQQTDLKIDQPIFPER